MTGPQPIPAQPTQPPSPSPHLDQLEASIKAGIVTPTGNNWVDVIRPDGGYDSVQASNLPIALSQGAHLASQYDKGIAEYAANNAGVMGAIKTGLAAAGNQALFGVPDILANASTDPAQQYSNAQAAALAKEHPIAHMVGNVAGVGGSLVLGGELAQTAGRAVGEEIAGQLGTGLVGRTLASAANLGTQAATFAAPKATAQLVLGNPQAAAESLIASVGIGSLLGAGGPLALKLGDLTKAMDDAVGAKAGSLLDKVLPESVQNVIPASVRKTINNTVGEVATTGGAAAALQHVIPGLGPVIVGVKTAAEISKWAGALLDASNATATTTIADAASKSGDMLDRIPEVVNSLATKTFGTPPSTIAQAAIPALMGSSYGEQGADLLQHLTNTQNAVGTFAANGPFASAQMANLTTPIAHVNPTVGSAYTNALANTVQHLSSIIPKPATPDNPLSNAKWAPDDIQMGRFNRSVNVINNPGIILDHLAAGTLTSGEMATMQAVYPNLLQLMRSKIVEALAQGNITIPAAKQIKLNLFMGVPIASPARLALLQQNFNIAPQNQPGKRSKTVPPDMVQNYETAMQQLQDGKDAG